MKNITDNKNFKILCQWLFKEITDNYKIVDKKNKLGWHVSVKHHDSVRTSFTDMRNNLFDIEVGIVPVKKGDSFEKNILAMSLRADEDYAINDDINWLVVYMNVLVSGGEYYPVERFPIRGLTGEEVARVGPLIISWVRNILDSAISNWRR